MQKLSRCYWLALLILWAHPAAQAKVEGGAAAAIPVLLEIKGPGADWLTADLKASFKNKRLRLGTDPAARYDFAVRAQVQSKIIRNEDLAWKWVKSEIQVEVVDLRKAKKPKVLEQFAESRRDGSLDLNAARRLTVKKLAPALAGKVEAAVVKNL